MFDGLTIIRNKLITLMFYNLSRFKDYYYEIK